MRGLHLDMAAMHWDIQRRHLAAARMHAAHADRLAAWAAGRVARAPKFMSAVAATVGARHVGVSLVLEGRVEAVTVSSGPVAAAAQDAEFTLGEGPVHDVTSAGVLLVADEPALRRRWPRFAPAVAGFGVRAVASAPLRTGTACLGALTVFDPPADPGQSARTLCTVADALVHSALLVPDGADPLDVPLLDGADLHAVVHQASGMVAEQLGCGAADALVVLRARAFGDGKPLAVIADEVVSRGLRLG